MNESYPGPEDRRDHLFISYASEDYELAEWLTLRLTAEGYKVWCDRIKLLGGESYPRDIDKAIKERTFRLLPLLSQHSIRKPNPLKERTLALNIGRERNIDFLIPLNVDGLSPTQLDWMTSDLTFIPFHENWAGGFAQLLKKLESIEAARPRADGRGAVCQWFASNNGVLEKPERIWTNLVEIRELPRALLKFTGPSGRLDPWPDAWPHYRQDSAVAWAFEPPANGSIALGERAVPLILHEFLRRPNHWSWALTEITGESPVPGEVAGDLDAIRRIWVRWGRDHGYL